MPSLYILATCTDGEMETSLHPDQADANAELWRVLGSIAEINAGEDPGPELAEFQQKGAELLATAPHDRFQESLGMLLADYPIDEEERFSWKIQHHEMPDALISTRLHDIISEAVESGRINRDTEQDYDELVELLVATANPPPAALDDEPEPEPGLSWSPAPCPSAARVAVANANPPASATPNPPPPTHQLSAAAPALLAAVDGLLDAGGFTAASLDELELEPEQRARIEEARAAIAGAREISTWKIQQMTPRGWGDLKGCAKDGTFFDDHYPVLAEAQTQAAEYEGELGFLCRVVPSTTPSEVDFYPPPTPPVKNRLVIHRDGGRVELVTSALPIEVIVLDFSDVEGADEDEIIHIPTAHGESKQALLFGVEVEVNPQHTAFLFKLSEPPTS